jgi:hypothetical protein
MRSPDDGAGDSPGVLKGERESGIAKPALLCLMGAAGTIELGVARDDETAAARRVFPSYRFPESAARALARAAQYAAFRRRPAGRLVWYDDVDAPAARQAVAGLRESATSGTLWLEAEAAAGILGAFGIPSRADEGPAPEGGEALLEMRMDRSCGPLVRVRRGGDAAAVRITRSPTGRLTRSSPPRRFRPAAGSRSSSAGSRR